MKLRECGIQVELMGLDLWILGLLNLVFPVCGLEVLILWVSRLCVLCMWILTWAYELGSVSFMNFKFWFWFVDSVVMNFSFSCLWFRSFEPVYFAFMCFMYVDFDLDLWARICEIYGFDFLVLIRGFCAYEV